MIDEIKITRARVTVKVGKRAVYHAAVDSSFVSIDAATAWVHLSAPTQKAPTLHVPLGLILAVAEQIQAAQRSPLERAIRDLVSALKEQQ